MTDTKRHLIDAGIALMRRKGFNATSVDEICLTAEVTKGAFFHYFKSKEDLAKAAILWFRENKITEFAHAPFRKLADPLDRFLGRLDYVEGSYGGENRHTRGCLFGMFAQEMAVINPALRSLCQEAFMETATDVERDLAEAKALHAPNAPIDPKAISLMYVTILQGSLMLAKTAESDRIIWNNLEQFRQYVKTLFGRSTPISIVPTTGTGDNSRN